MRSKWIVCLFFIILFTKNRWSSRVWDSSLWFCIFLRIFDFFYFSSKRRCSLARFCAWKRIFFLINNCWLNFLFLLLLVLISCLYVIFLLFLLFCVFNIFHFFNNRFLKDLHSWDSLFNNLLLLFSLNFQIFNFRVQIHNEFILSLNNGTNLFKLFFSFSIYFSWLGSLCLFPFMKLLHEGFDISLYSIWFFINVIFQSLCNFLIVCFYFVS